VECFEHFIIDSKIDNQNYFITDTNKSDYRIQFINVNFIAVYETKLLILRVVKLYIISFNESIQLCLLQRKNLKIHEVARTFQELQT